MEKIVEEEGMSNFQECSGANSMCLSKHGLFKTDVSCEQTVFVKYIYRFYYESIYRLKQRGR